MGRSNGKDEEVRDPLDPITGKPASEPRLNSLMRGVDEESGDLDDDAVIPANPERSTTGNQFIAHIEDPDDINEMLPQLWAAETSPKGPRT